jgi:hypothetical protein
MIDQIADGAHHAHHEGIAALNWKHLVDSMTVIESGSAVGVEYHEADARATAIHEAGHAASARLPARPRVQPDSIKMRGNSSGTTCSRRRSGSASSRARCSAS